MAQLREMASLSMKEEDMVEEQPLFEIPPQKRQWIHDVWKEDSTRRELLRDAGTSAEPKTNLEILRTDQGLLAAVLSALGLAFISTHEEIEARYMPSVDREVLTRDLLAWLARDLKLAMEMIQEDYPNLSDEKLQAAANTLDVHFLSVRDWRRGDYEANDPPAE